MAGSVLTQLEIQTPEIIKRNSVLLVCIVSILLSIPVFAACKNTFGIYTKWQKRIEYITSEKKKGNLDIVVKAPIPAYDQHAASTGLYDITNDKNAAVNVWIAKYYGLRSIKGVENDEPW
jgi:hypothetical protein